MAFAGDPVGSGLVATLARPGGNITGLSTMATELSAKRLQLLKEAIPRVTRVAVLWNPDTPYLRKDDRGPQGGGPLALDRVELRRAHERLRRSALRSRLSAERTQGSCTFSVPARSHHLGTSTLTSHGARRQVSASYHVLPSTHYRRRGRTDCRTPPTRDSPVPPLSRTTSTRSSRVRTEASLPIEQPTPVRRSSSIARPPRPSASPFPESILLRADEVIR